MSCQLDTISLDDLVSPIHRYRYFKQVFTDPFITGQLGGLSKTVGRTGYGIDRLFKCLLLQFMEDLSDRECELFYRRMLRRSGFVDWVYPNWCPIIRCYAG